MPRALTGLWPPVSTPFQADGAVDTGRLVMHSKRLLADGATGLAILGTTSEANSLTLEERRRVIDAHIEEGVEADRLLPGTGACAVDDVVALARHAHDLGCAGVLLLPPFYYKNVNDDGIFAFMARLIDKLGARAPRIMLYHIPPQAVIGWSVPLIARLREAYPEIIAGIKDSSGSWDVTKSFLDANPDPGFAVFPGAEVYVVKALQHGAAGCISATANVNAHGISRLMAAAGRPEAEGLQAEVNAVRKAVEGRGTIMAAKAVLAARYRDEAWLNVRPPLLPISAGKRAELMADPAIVSLLAGVPA